MTAASAAAAILLSTSLAASGPTVVLRMHDPALVESSGLAVSGRHPGVVWTHPDGGTVAQVMAVDRRGDTVATLTLDGINPYDPEALAPGSDGRSLWLGDIGDNSVRRPDVSAFLVDRAAPARRPDGPRTVVPLHLPRRAARRRGAAGRPGHRPADDRDQVLRGRRPLPGTVDAGDPRRTGSTGWSASPTCRHSSPTAPSCPTVASCCGPTPTRTSTTGPVTRSTPSRCHRSRRGSRSPTRATTRCWSAARAGTRRSTAWRSRPGRPTPRRRPGRPPPGVGRAGDASGRPGGADSDGWRTAYLVARAVAIVVILGGIIAVLRRRRR